MSEVFKEIKPTDISDNVFKLIGDDWMLITAGTPESYNTMTASWGGLGILWGEPVSYIFIRPHRYTYNFVEKNETYSLSFFDEKYRKALQYCGTHSGRDVDKAAATGLTVVGGDCNTVYFNEARLVLLCKKIYFQDINPENFLDPVIGKNYPKKDYHRMYIGKVIKCLIKQA
ncbi:MAG TPA: flavin reductase family protein [Clostridiaceae bacterium]|nr:flavin reductase family protein [Clostridiaceae bacterium]